MEKISYRLVYIHSWLKTVIILVHVSGSYKSLTCDLCLDTGVFAFAPAIKIHSCFLTWSCLHKIQIRSKSISHSVTENECFRNN